MNLTAIFSLPVIYQLSCLRALYFNDANIVVSDPPAISNQSPPPVQPATLPEGYIAYPEIDAAYKFMFFNKKWSDAREQCNLEGAHLAILDSKRKLEYVRNTISHTYHRTSDWINLWIGIYRMDQKWADVSTGKTLADLPWQSGYPSSSTDYDCAVASVHKTDGSYIQNTVCRGEFYYLCEVPIPTAYKTQ